MRFLIDAQLPRALAYALTDLGHVASHALLLPNGNATTDRKIAEFADLDLERFGFFRWATSTRESPTAFVGIDWEYPKP